MKILFFSDYFIPEIGAPAAHVYDRCKIWVEQGHEVTVITNNPNYPSGIIYDGFSNRIRRWENIEGINVLRIWTYPAENRGTFRRTLDYISYFLSSFINSIFIKKPDVVISTSPHIFTPLGAIFFSIIKRVPHVVEIRDLWPESIAATTSMKKTSLIYKIFQLLELFIYKHSKNIILYTNSFRLNLKSKGISEKKMDVVINGANLEIFKKIPYDYQLANNLGLNGKFTIAYFGTHGLAHNLYNAIYAANLVKDDDIHILFVGEGAIKNKMIALSKSLNLENVHFLKRQPRIKLSRFWSIASAGLVHLKNDPVFESVIPSKIFETMAMELPIIYCGPESDGAKIIRNNNCGIIAPPDSPKDLAESFRTIKNDNVLYKELKNNSKNSAIKYSRISQAKGTLKVLKKAASI